MNSLFMKSNKIMSIIETRRHFSWSNFLRNISDTTKPELIRQLCDTFTHVLYVLNFLCLTPVFMLLCKLCFINLNCKVTNN